MILKKKKYKAQIGDRFGKLTIISFDGYNENNVLIITCKCDCGNTKIMPLANFKRNTKSCGCYKKESAIEKQSKPLLHLAVVSTINNCRLKTKNTDLDFDSTIKLITSNCYYCEQSAESCGKFYRRPKNDGREIKIMGLDRIDSSIGYYKNNIVPCCKTCNIIKRDHSLEFLSKRLEIILKNLYKIKCMENI
jgi:hypothetical protein